MDLAELLADAMRRQHLSAEALAYATGIRAPRIKAFAEDGAEGPIRPTREELTELARALSLPLPAVLGVNRDRRAVAHAGQQV
ncbi:XRE family transcriptional regulator [Streptomyces sp. 5-8]|uniref:XRE family transcriptional regulator n=1 Tax=Streptomyces musisoli TaxID=2802280 RepID=A0ABS1NTR2_9ACTN|nr:MULTISPECIES: XRE family transcriptional regulator [Streptomyces]MBL1103486.1 XRE family transcriptional regulator [Streptomyces musisoli]MBY8839908.1 XRE family transcriptional regulator [Streptomyces sp. SP2-10]